MTALLLLPFELALAGLLGVTRHAQRKAERRLHSIRRCLQEGKRLSEARERARERQAKVEKTVDRSTDTVEAVHRALADLSFDLWGSYSAEQARARHHQHADQIYNSIRFANKGVGKLISGLFGSDDKRNKNKD